MIILEKTQSAIKSFDMFYSKQFLRYKTSNQYKTITGGLVTLTVLVTISISFASMFLETLARVNITYDTTTLKTSDPTLTTVKMGPGNKFMFGIRMMPQQQQSGNNNMVFNLSDSKRYFNINFLSSVLQSGNFASYQPIPLQTCTRAHWSEFPNILNQFQKMQMDRWLCPPLNASFDLMGQYSSQLSKMAIFTVTACNNYSNFNSVQSVCATPQQIQAYFAEHVNFLFGYLFVNPVLNPGQTDYIDYYLESLTQAIFSEFLSSDNLINYADYEINSDNSIWPFESINKDVGIILDGSMGSRPLTKTPHSTSYLRMMLFKSSTSLKVTRTVQKLSSTFSYIGGFFGAIATALFLLKIYTDQAFEISLIKTVFVWKKGLQESNFLNNFNILKFLVVKFYALMKLVKIPWNWQKGDQVDIFQQQIKKQLDISFILHRLINLQKMMTCVLTDEQIRELNLCRRLSLQKIRVIQQKLGYTDDFLNENENEGGEQCDVKMKDKEIRYLSMEHSRNGSLAESTVRQFTKQGILRSMKENIYAERMQREGAEVPVVFGSDEDRRQIVIKAGIANIERLSVLKQQRKREREGNVNGKVVIVDNLKVQMKEMGSEGEQNFG